MRWVTYDRQYRREALARRDLNWSVTDPRLYNEAFTGRARAIARCSYCLQDDHSAPLCPRNPNRPLVSWFPDPSAWAGQPPQAAAFRPPPQRSDPRQEACRRYNQGKCKLDTCRFAHVCSSCQGLHPVQDCPRRTSNWRSRSPIRQTGRGRQPRL